MLLLTCLVVLCFVTCPSASACVDLTCLSRRGRLVWEREQDLRAAELWLEGEKGPCSKSSTP